MCSGAAGEEWEFSSLISHVSFIVSFSLIHVVLLLSFQRIMLCPLLNYISIWSNSVHISCSNPQQFDALDGSIRVLRTMTGIYFCLLLLVQLFFIDALQESSKIECEMLHAEEVCHHSLDFETFLLNVCLLKDVLCATEFCHLLWRLIRSCLCTWNQLIMKTS